MTDRTAHEHQASDEAAREVGAKGPDELRRQIERTRGELGDTVEELAGIVDVRGRARARAADLRDKAGAKTVQLRGTASRAGHAVRRGKSHAVEGEGHTEGHALPGPDPGPGPGPGPVRGEVGAGRRYPRPVLVAGAVGVGAMVAVIVGGALRRCRGRR